MVNLRFTDAELAEVEDYRFRHRFPSRHEALKFLLQYALEKDPAREEEATKK